jgi:hypothetical protein
MAVTMATTIIMIAQLSVPTLVSPEMSGRCGTGMVVMSVGPPRTAAGLHSRDAPLDMSHGKC